MLPPALRKHMFKKGEVRNPAGRGGEYQRCLMLCREASFEAAQEIIRLSKKVKMIASDTWLVRGSISMHGESPRIMTRSLKNRRKSHHLIPATIHRIS